MDWLTIVYNDTPPYSSIVSWTFACLENKYCNHSKSHLDSAWDLQIRRLNYFAVRRFELATKALSFPPFLLSRGATQNQGRSRSMIFTTRLKIPENNKSLASIFPFFFCLRSLTQTIMWSGIRPIMWVSATNPGCAPPVIFLDFWMQCTASLSHPVYA